MFFPLESAQDTGHLTCSTPGRSQTRGSLTPVVADEQPEHWKWLSRGVDEAYHVVTCAE